MDIVWVRIRSYHAVRTPTRAPGTYLTLCGRRATGDNWAQLGAEKSCESCLRIVARQADTSTA